MQRDRTRRIYDLHSWTGVLLGLFVFVVSLSGVFSLFGKEIAFWAEPAARADLPGPPAPVMPQLEAFVATMAGSGRLSGITLHLPTGFSPFTTAFVAVSDPESGERQVATRRWRADDGTVLLPHGDGLAHWLVDFHARLMLPRTLGRAIVGVAGIALLVLAISGLVTHRKLISEFFTWRIDRSVRLKWQDSHKAIGLWGTPFHVMIAFTGAWLGMIAILVAIASLLVFKGDQGALFEAIAGPFEPSVGAPAEMSSIDDAALAAARAAGSPARIVSIEHWGDASAHYDFLHPAEDVLASYRQVEVGGVDGEVRRVYVTDRDGFTFRINPAMVALHYATFGGIGVKFLYAVLGALLCVLSATGLMLWVERRKHGNAGRADPRPYDLIGRLSLGAMTGVVMASIAIFHVERLYAGEAAARLQWIGISYFAVWTLCCLYAMARSNGYRACRQLLAATAVLASVIPAHDLVMALGEGTAYALHPMALAVDAVALFVGVSLGVAVRLVPHRRPVTRRA